MVGVAGKSKGCNTCRNRKIACDLQRPECSQCLKSNRQCSGYQRQTAFLNRSSIDGRVQISRSSATASSSTLTSHESVVLRTPSPRSSINNRLVYRDGFVGSFMDLYLPTYDRQAAYGDRVSLTWLQIAVDLPNPGEALQSAISALSIVAVGRASGDPHVLAGGISMYSKALEDHSRALQDRSLILRDETLAATMALSLYELYENTNSVEGWIAHGQGISSLVQLRGSLMYQSAFAHQLYEDCRYISMILDIQRRKSSFWKDFAWLSDPWHGKTKSLLQKLIDSGLMIPIYLELIDLLASARDPGETHRLSMEVINKCWALDSNLRTWWENLLDQVPGPHYWTQLSAMANPTDNHENGKVFPVSFQFPNLRIAHTLLTYWSLSIIVNSSLLLTYRAISRNPLGRTIMDSLPPLGDMQNGQGLQLLTDNVAQSMEYCMRTDHGTLGSQWAVFPLRTAIESYRNFSPRKAAWCEAVSATLTKQKGLQYSESVSSQEWVGLPGHATSRCQSIG